MAAAAGNRVARPVLQHRPTTPVHHAQPQSMRQGPLRSLPPERQPKRCYRQHADEKSSSERPSLRHGLPSVCAIMLRRCEETEIAGRNCKSRRGLARGKQLHLGGCRRWACRQVQHQTPAENAARGAASVAKYGRMWSNLGRISEPGATLEQLWATPRNFVGGDVQGAWRR